MHTQKHTNTATAIKCITSFSGKHELKSQFCASQTKDVKYYSSLDSKAS